MNDNWKDFEKLVRKIQQELMPHAQVTLDERIVGRDGGPNQCDVVVRAKVGQYDFFCVIECKDLSKKVGVEVIREFRSKLEDIGATKGAIVSAKGFTRGAIQKARSYNINLYRLVDAQSRKWQDEAIIPILVTHIYLTKVEPSIVYTATGNVMTMTDSNGEIVPLERIHLIDIKENRYMRLRELMEREWDKIFKNHLPDMNEIFETEEDRYLVAMVNGPDLPVTIRCKFFPEIKYHYGNVPLAECQGFIDQETGALLTNGFLSVPLDFWEATKMWPFTTEREQIPIKPVFTFFMGKFFGRRTNPAPRAVSIQMKNTGI